MKLDFSVFTPQPSLKTGGTGGTGGTVNVYRVNSVRPDVLPRWDKWDKQCSCGFGTEGINPQTEREAESPMFIGLSHLSHHASTYGGTEIATVYKDVPPVPPENIDGCAETKIGIPIHATAAIPDAPLMPPGVVLVRWEPVPAPVRPSACETVLDTEVFLQSTLRQLGACLRGRTWQAGNWTLAELIDRLAAVGCVVELEDREADVQKEKRQ